MSCSTPHTADEYQFTVQPEDSGKRLDKYLAEQLPDYSRSRLRTLIDAGALTYAPEASPKASPAPAPALKIQEGAKITLKVPEAIPATPRGEAIPLKVVYEDEDLIVIDKPAGMVVHPAPGNPDKTLVNALIAHCGESLSGIGGEKRPGIVHRIDKDTSGLLVVAKNDRAHKGLATQFADHSLERAYAALIWGSPARMKGDISGNLGRDPRNRKKIALLKEGGKRALTHYRVNTRYGDAASLVTCQLETGRTHQIRVHMASIGHPIIGDPLYSQGFITRAKKLPPRLRGMVEKFPRQALHAKLIGFTHPVSGEFLRFESVLPDDMDHLCKAFDLL